MSVHVENRKLVLRAGVRSEHPIDGTLVAENIIETTTNGTTAVNVFGSKGAPFSGTITGVFVIALDTTAGNITPKVNSNTVVTIAKGTTAGVLVGGVTLANTSFNPGDTVQVVSSSAGNAQVFITYTRAV
jgi:hypothetical protein